MDQRAGTSTRLPAAGSPSDVALLMGAVREDMRQTLRVAWLPPAVDAAADHPAFLAAAWSTIRPNVGRTYDAVSRGLLAEAVRSLRDMGQVPDVGAALARRRGEPEMRRIRLTAAAAQETAVRTHLAVHLLACAVRGEGTGGTGEEEPPSRRGIPDWQRWITVAREPVPAGAEALDRVRRAMGSVPPPALRLLAEWPDALTAAWRPLRPLVAGDAWRRAELRLRLATAEGARGLPHRVHLQWHALRRRGFSEGAQADLRRLLVAHERALPATTLTAAFVWLAFGAPTRA
jgi:hypothetical protein